MERKNLMKISANALSIIGIIMLILSVGADEKLPIGLWLAYTAGLFVCSLLTLCAADYLNNKVEK